MLEYCQAQKRECSIGYPLLILKFSHISVEMRRDELKRKNSDCSE
jgi:hypothetical protein